MSSSNSTSNSTLSRLPLHNGKDISLDFSGGNVTSDTGPVLLAELDARMGLTKRIASCITATRQQVKIVHSLHEMIQQRVFQISCGCEDCNDAQTLRQDPIFKIAVGRSGKILPVGAFQKWRNDQEGSRRGVCPPQSQNEETSHSWSAVRRKKDPRVMDFLVNAVSARIMGKPAPSLVPVSTG